MRTLTQKGVKLGTSIKNIFKFVRTWIFIILSVIFFLSLFGWHTLKPGSLLRALSSIGLSNSIGALLIVFFIDKLLRWERSNRERPVRKIALERVVEVINHLSVLVAEMKKASTPPEEEWEVPSNFEELFSESTAKQVCGHLDISRKGAPTTGSTAWRQYLSRQCKIIESKTHWTISKYVEFLPPKLLAKLEEVSYSKMFYYAKDLPIIHERDKESNTERGTSFAPGGEEVIRKDFENILEVKNRVEEELASYEEVEKPRSPESVLSNRSEPMVGSAYTEEGL